jgi:hypothetical protein
MDREIAAKAKNGRFEPAAPGSGDTVMPDTITPGTIAPIDARIQVVILQHRKDPPKKIELSPRIR